MDIATYKKDVWGREVLLGVSWDWLWVILAVSLVAIAAHALFMAAGHHFGAWRSARHGVGKSVLSKAVIVAVVVAWQFIAVVTEVTIWAWLYLKHPLITALPDLETALYFSMATFTTVGYGDVVLEGSWRMLASLQAANGMIIFGWSTALIFYYIQRIYAPE